MPCRRDDGDVSVSPATGSTGSNRSVRASERRSYWIAAIVLFAAIAALTATAVLTTSSGPRKDTDGQIQEQGGAKPHIIPRPGEGETPDRPNDRGGWQQVLVLGLVVAGLGGVAGLAWRSSRRARRRASAGVRPRRDAGAGRLPAESSSPQ